MYVALRQKLAKEDLTLTINSDGSPAFKSSKYSIWPVQLTLNELPPRLRHKNVLVSTLWYGQTHPDMTLLLTAFAHQMQHLALEGVTWNNGMDAVRSQV